MVLAFTRVPMDYIFPLPKPSASPPKPQQAVIHAGHRYLIEYANLAAASLGELEHDMQNGLLGSYVLSVERGEAAAVNIYKSPIEAFVWNSDSLRPTLKKTLSDQIGHLTSPVHNRLTLLGCSLTGPDIQNSQDTPILSITPHYELNWSTPAYASQLGVIQLVESKRTVHFTDGDSQVILDTNTPQALQVLYLPNAKSHSPITLLGSIQAQGELKTLRYQHTVTQLIPEQINGKAVESVSVLEKYTLYFMQNADPNAPERYIWVPVHLPVVWGWSIRVQQRYDGAWDVFRKKLILPSVSTEAAGLPLWQRNSQQCQTDLFT